MYKQGDGYGALLNNMAICHQKLQQWNEAVACYKEAVEHRRNLFGTSHPEYATSLNNLARAVRLAQAVRGARFEEVLIIFQKVYGDQHERTVGVAEGLAFVRLQAQQSLRGDIDVGHTHHVQPVRQGQGDDGRVQWLPPCLVL
jgi:hypothetical protein